MNILVFTKRVPATQEEELRIIDEGQGIDLSKVPFKVNDWDNYSVEEAVRIVEKFGGTVTAISIGDAESDEVLRRAIAMGVKDGFLVETGDVLHDPNARATLMKNFLKKENVPFDAIFTGVQSEDDQFAAVGGILAAKLGLPFASMVIGIDAIESDHVIARRELEGGLQERVKILLPCVISIQTGINEPRTQFLPVCGRCGGAGGMAADGRHGSLPRGGDQRRTGGAASAVQLRGQTHRPGVVGPPGTRRSIRL